MQHNLILICNEENYGFADGNNIGIRVALKRTLIISYYLTVTSHSVPISYRSLFEWLQEATS